MTASQKIQQVLASPDVSYWLKDALRGLLERDAVDATKDAELLAKLMSERLDEILGQSSPA